MKLPKLPHSMKSRARDRFEAWAITYDRSLLNRFLFLPSYQIFLEELYAWRGESGEPFELLDVGCGTGTFDLMLAASPLKARIVGLDYAPSMCKVARRKAEQTRVGGRLSYVAADSEHLPFADASFDAVTCSNSFHHYPHQQNVVMEMRRVLRPGGRLLLIDGFRDNIVGWMTFDVIIGAVEKEVFHAPWSTIHRYFEAAGFREIRRRKFNYWFPGLLTVGIA
mgnify:CR=1 FL=1|jgi:ubiquinone/menaquinone biosynthesis C-methylase UbiE